MRINTIDVIKRPVHCFGCSGEYYFTLRAIIERQELSCPHCHGTINLFDDVYRILVGDVQDAVLAITEILTRAETRA
jgi:hypothetical protein